MYRGEPIIVETPDPRPKTPVWFGENYLPTLIDVSIAAGFVYGYLYKSPIRSFQIDRLQNLELLSPLTVILETDGDGYIARTPDLPLYGYGNDSIDAINMLKGEIENLYSDLMEDDNFSEDWLMIKKFLIGLINGH